MADHQKGFALELRHLKVRYGGIQAVKGVSLSVRPGELVTLIGANGAGKTTTLKAITGLIGTAEGQIFFNGDEITAAPAYTLPARGLVMVPEGRGVFTRMTIRENLLMGAHCLFDRHHRQEHTAAADIQDAIDAQLALFPRLKERLTQLAGTLSGGEQQMLAMARALMARPSLLLLDEPSMGLSPVMVEKIFDVIRDISANGVTILLVEQNARLALQAADRGYVMDSGMITTSADAKTLLNDPAVRAAYLGE
ncbi:MAG: ABC transporter ATP-binding protein [Burkholderiaceae bacterium]|jgi:branched-chain amino acid transport system ATP-binding protein|nr:ABC transporter ATP-binding protein [Burkholderiaceae bacterium]